MLALTAGPVACETIVKRYSSATHREHLAQPTRQNPPHDMVTRPSSSHVSNAVLPLVGAGAAESPVLDLEALARLKALDPTGANDLLARVLKAFKTSAARLMPQLEAARVAHDSAAIRFVAHTLKSSSASIGAARLSALCANVESMIRNEAADGLDAGLDGMTAAMADVLKVIDTLLAAQP